MNIYLISQDAVSGWDTYDSAVVCAMSEEDAKNMHPGGGLLIDEKWPSYSWATKSSDVTAKLIGTAVEGAEAGVVCSSFNAG